MTYAHVHPIVIVLFKSCGQKFRVDSFVWIERSLLACWVDLCEPAERVHFIVGQFCRRQLTLFTQQIHTKQRKFCFLFFFQIFYFLTFFAERELNSGVINNLVFRNITDCGDLFVLLGGEEEGLGHDAGVNPLGVVSLENVK
jgi:hypothetical protein